MAGDTKLVRVTYYHYIIIDYSTDSYCDSGIVPSDIELTLTGDMPQVPLAQAGGALPFGGVPVASLKE